MSDRLRVGLLGAGPAVQAAHIPALMSLPTMFEITHVADAGPAAGEVASRCEAETVPAADLSALTDAILVASPVHRRAFDAVTACRNGTKAVYIEPPCGLTAAETDAIKTVATESGTTVVVGAIHVFDAAFQDAKHLMADMKDRALLARVISTVPSDEAAVSAQTSPVEDSAAEGDAMLTTLASLIAVAGPGSSEGIAPLAELFRRVGIHDLPLLSKTFGALSVEHASGFDGGYHIFLRAGEMPVRMTAFASGIRRTDWRFELIAKDAHVRVEFPPAVLSGVGSRALRFDALGTVEPPPVNETGYRAAWRQLYQAVTDGKSLEYGIEDAAADMRTFEEILRKAGGVSEEAQAHARPAVVHVGAGMISTVHLGLAASEGRIARVASRTVESARRRAILFGADAATLEDPSVLDDAEALIVAGIPETHLSDSLPAIRSGIPVLVEKPLTRTVGEAWAMRQAVHESGGVFVYGENWAFQNIVQRAATIAGERGVRSISVTANWQLPKWGLHMNPEYGGAALFDGGPHPIELARVLLGRPQAEWVEAELGPQEGPSPDTRANVRIGFVGGKLADIAVRWEGDVHEIHAEAPGFRVELSPRKVIEVENVPIKVKPAVGVGAGIVDGGYLAQIHALLGRGPVLAGIDDGVAVMEIIAAAYLSAGTGQRVALPYSGPSDLSPYELWKGKLSD